MTADISTLVITLLAALVSARYGDRYPVSASWFRDRYNAREWNTTLDKFAKMGGDTVILTGGKLQIYNRTEDSIAKDPHFIHCVSNGKTCAAEAREELESEMGLNIVAWVTYSHEDNFSKELMACDRFDKRIEHKGEVFYRLVLWMEEQRAATDCTFVNGSKVTVLFTSFNKGNDSNELLLASASERNMTAYLGFPQAPYINGTLDSDQVILAYYAFVYRILQDAKQRLKKFPAMKGFYSSEKVVPSYIIAPPSVRPYNQSLPSNYHLIYWREIAMLTGYSDFQMLITLDIDLTRAGNTSIVNHTLGLTSLRMFAPAFAFLIREGRGEGKAAYFWPSQAENKISDLDPKLWEILHEQNSSVNTNTTFSDIYYASIRDFYEIIHSGSDVIKDMPVWLVIQAFEELAKGTYCHPVSSSWTRQAEERASKQRLDHSLSGAGSLVRKVAAYSWDPHFTCTAKSLPTTLAQDVDSDYKRPIISECRFLPDNKSIAAIGYNLDSPNLNFQVTYTSSGEMSMSVAVKACHFDLDYGKTNHLVKSLVYAELCSPTSELQPSTTVIVLPKGAFYACIFNTNGTDRNEEIFGR